MPLNNTQSFTTLNTSQGDSLKENADTSTPLQINSTHSYTLQKEVYLSFQIMLDTALNVSITINTSVKMNFFTQTYFENYNSEIHPPGGEFAFYLTPDTNNEFKVYSNADTEITITVLGYTIQDFGNHNSENAYPIDLDFSIPYVLNLTGSAYETDWYQFVLSENNSLRIFADSYSSSLSLELYSQNMTLLDSSHLAPINDRLDASILGSYPNGTYYIKVTEANQVNENSLGILYTLSLSTVFSELYQSESWYSSYYGDRNGNPLFYFGTKTVTIQGSVVNGSQLDVPFDTWDQGGYQTEFTSWPDNSTVYTISDTSLINQTNSLVGYHPPSKTTFSFGTALKASDFVLIITQEIADYTEYYQMMYGYSNVTTHRASGYNVNLNYPGDVDTFAFFPPHLGNLTLQIQSSDKVKVTLFHENGTQFNSTVITKLNTWNNFQVDLINDSIGIRVEHANSDEILTYYSLNLEFSEQPVPYTPRPRTSSTHSNSKKIPILTLHMSILTLVVMMQLKRKLKL